ncbi:MAG: peptidoglycan DD-metalloendopeptidase family protein [Elusimicrobia bacterium]|nr:peptidoglycan DD-metalloendopeptidase family protein [Elusimicrobiota bacterium]
MSHRPFRRRSARRAALLAVALAGVGAADAVEAGGRASGAPSRKASAAADGDKAGASKRLELNRIQKEMQEARQDIERYRQLEKVVRHDVEKLEVQSEAARRKLSSIQGDLNRTEEKRQSLRSRLLALRTVGGLWRSMVVAETAQYVSERAARDDAFGSRSLWKEEFRRSAIVEKTALVAGLEGVASKTERLVGDAQAAALKLSEAKGLAAAEKLQTEAQYQGKKAEMDGIKERTQAALERARELEESAKALRRMLESIAKLSKIVRPSGGLMSLPKHALPWPCEGRLVSRFGKEKDAKLGSWSINQGIRIETAAQAAVGAVAAGRVIFAGPFRSYGQVVILDHGEFFSVYGELGEILKKKGDPVLAGEAVARTSLHGSAGRLYLEIRLGSEALDPLVWLKSLDPPRGRVE